MASATQYLLISAGAEKGSSNSEQDSLTRLNKVLLDQGHIENDALCVQFGVPTGDDSFMLGSFDNLVRLTDDLAKQDGKIESDLRRLERALLEGQGEAAANSAKEIEKKVAAEEGTGAEKAAFAAMLKKQADDDEKKFGVFEVLSQRTKMHFEQYVGVAGSNQRARTDWQWDEAKYPKGRDMRANVEAASQLCGRLDEEARSKASAYNELKSNYASLAKADAAGSYTNKDLVEVLTPDVVRQEAGDQDFATLGSTHFTTAVCVVGKGGEKEFLEAYELSEDEAAFKAKLKNASAEENAKLKDKDEDFYVVPGSARKFNVPEDKEGNTLWRVVLFKEAKERFSKQCRERKIVIRDFTYDPGAVRQLQKDREELEGKMTVALGQWRRLTAAAWSDVMVAWMHVKAMRVFVECVLRHGPDVKFDTFLVPFKTKNMPQMRKDLEWWVHGNQSYAAIEEGRKNAAAADAEGEEYYPYVCLDFVPFASK